MGRVVAGRIRFLSTSLEGFRWRKRKVSDRPAGGESRHHRSISPISPISDHNQTRLQRTKQSTFVVFHKAEGTKTTGQCTRISRVAALPGTCSSRTGRSMAPAPDPVVLRGHGGDVQCATFANVGGILCVLSGCVTRFAPTQPTPILSSSLAPSEGLLLFTPLPPPRGVWFRMTGSRRMARARDSFFGLDMPVGDGRLLRPFAPST